MKAQRTALIIAGSMGTVAAACLVLALVLVLETRSLRTELADSQRRWSEAVVESGELRGQQASTAAALTRQQERVGELEQELRDWQSQAATDAARPARAQVARVFANGRYVGLGWVLAPGTNSTDAAGGGWASVVMDSNVSAQAAAAGQGREPAAWGAWAAGAGDGASYAYAYQSYPYYWAGGWWGGGWCPTNDPPAEALDPTAPTMPPAGAPPAPSVSPPTQMRSFALRAPMAPRPSAAAPLSPPASPVAAPVRAGVVRRPVMVAPRVNATAAPIRGQPVPPRR